MTYYPNCVTEAESARILEATKALIEACQAPAVRINSPEAYRTQETLSLALQALIELTLERGAELGAVIQGLIKGGMLAVYDLTDPDNHKAVTNFAVAQMGQAFNERETPGVFSNHSKPQGNA